MNKVKLGDIGKVSMCKRILKNQTMEKGDIPFFKISTFGGEADVFISKNVYKKYRNKFSFPKKGDILISAAGTIGKTVIYDGKPAYFQDSNIVWIENDEKKVLNRYLYYFYQTKPWQTTNGSTITRIYNNNLRDITITFPNISTQSAIVQVLSSLDNKIELNNKINKELESMAKELYNYWFVQNADKNWEKKKLEEIGVNVIRGVTYSKNNIKMTNDKDAIGILRATNINGNIIDLDNLVYVDKSLISENQKLKLFDILITMSSGSKEHVGKNGLFCFDNVNVAFGAFCSKIDVGEGYKLFIYEHFQSERFKNYIKSCCLGTNINNLTNEIIKNILIMIPPTTILQKFNKIVSPLFSTMIKNQQENFHLAQLRDFLLPLLMNGQVKVINKK